MAQIANINVSRETEERLRAFAALVAKWNPTINLISRKTIHEIWDRHIIDSAQLYPLAPSGFKTWVDLGSGGGFPGIVMACIGAEHQPDASFVLIESDQRKSTFLRTAARELSLNVTVIADRIEAVPAQNADVVSARALADLDLLLSFISFQMGSHGMAIVHKGRQAEREIADASLNWSFDLEDHPSITDPDARLLSIQRIRPRAD